MRPFIPLRLLPLAAFLVGICGSVSAQQAPAPIGAWQTTNGCFLAAFLVAEGGHAEALYQSGEEDNKAAWTWDGRTLSIASKTFPLDQFSGQLTDGKMKADYVWHDLDQDKLNRQACEFDYFTPLRF